jgi:hypothetical protein
MQCRGASVRFRAALQRIVDLERSEHGACEHDQHDGDN